MYTFSPKKIKRRHSASWFLTSLEGHTCGRVAFVGQLLLVPGLGVWPPLSSLLHIYGTSEGLSTSCVWEVTRKA